VTRSLDARLDSLDRELEPVSPAECAVVEKGPAGSLALRYGDECINYSAPPTLSRLQGSDAFFRLAMGPVGSGKTSACVVEMVRRAIEQEPFEGVRRTRFAVVRNTYRELEDTTRKTFESWIPESFGSWREADFAFDLRLPLEDGTTVESEILFRALDRPKDVKKLLSLELSGCYFNELREIPKTIVDAMKTRVSRYPAKKDGGPTWFGIWGDTNPWHQAHWGHLVFRDPPPGWEIYRQPSGRSANAENLDNLEANYYERLIAGADSEWIKVYVDGEDAASVVGSIWGDAIAALGEQPAFAHGNGEVFTAWDLGRADATAIWWFRSVDRERIEVIDHYENHLQKLAHYFDVIDSKSYVYAKHWLPHDARAKTLQTGVSVLEQSLQRWPGKVAIVPSLSIQDGLAAARWLLEKKRIRFHPRCEKGLDALRAYRRQWDPESRAYSNTPVHDWSSHTADAFRYLALVVKRSGLLKHVADEARAAAEPKKVEIPSLAKAITWDRFWEHEQSLSGTLARRKRI
jgi:hypothetical protein